MLRLLPLLLALELPTVRATQSVYSCPLSPGFSGVVPGFNGVGEICGSGSFLHYWTCCEDFPFECCFQFEVWAM
ncbi:Protein of unknown function DUF2650 family-containing protein [Aphelenchoides fujianensis]|nr:Protein of unknown function DUF2650 family-containing protein [Aphelenchoides fujianensis]